MKFNICNKRIWSQIVVSVLIVCLLGTAFPPLSQAEKSGHDVAIMNVGSGNLINNSDFEADSSFPTHWDPGVMYNGSWEMDESERHGGSLSVKLKTTDESDMVWLVQHQIPVQGGGLYELVGYYKLQNMLGGAFMIVDWYSPSGFIRQSKLDVDPQANGWRKLELVDFAPDNATYAELALHSRYGAGTVWFDDISVKRIVMDSEIMPASVHVDLNPEQLKDIPVTMTKNGNLLRNLVFDENVLQAGIDYSVSGNTVTLKKEWLASVPMGNRSLLFKFSGGSDRELTLSVLDSTGTNVSQFKYYKKVTDQHLSVTTQDAVTRVYNGAALLTQGQAYMIQGNTVTFNNAYLESQTLGDHIIRLELADGGSASLMLTVVEITSSKTRSTIYTTDKVQAARANITKFEWAADLRDQAVSKAETYLATGYDFLWKSVPPQTLPRSYAVNEAKGSPISGLDINKFGAYPYQADPINEPWKLIDPSAKDENGNFMRYPTNDFGAFYESGLDENGIFRRELANEELLENTLYPEKGKTWGVDDGSGWVDENGNRYSFIAYYTHWFLWYSYKNALIQDAIVSLRDAYIYTGDSKYARAGTILLDRIADVYPSLDTFPYYPTYFHNGVEGVGKAVGSIWETFLVKDFISAYDAFYPAMDDPDIVQFLGVKSQQYHLDNPKNNGAAIRRNIEDGIIRQIYPSVKKAQIRGNIGMHQSALAMAAVVMDSMPETKEWLDFLFQSGGLEFNPQRVTGGNVLPSFVNLVDRDGHGDESSPLYNSFWLDQFRMTADVLRGYDLYPAADLYQNVKFKKMFTNEYSLILSDLYIPQIGDSGRTGQPGLYMNIDHMLQAYDVYREPIFAQVAYLINGNRLDGIHGNIFSANPEQITADIANVIDDYGPMNLGSENLTGYGFAALREGMGGTANNGLGTLRDLWMYYGRTTGHGHRDTLNIGLHAYGLDLSPDIGYPEFATTSDVNRYQWLGNTISHNTVVVDQARQSDQWVAEPKHFDDGGMVKLIDVEAPGSYPQTELYKRTTAMIKVDDANSYMVDLFRVKGGNDHHFSFHGAEGNVTTDGLNLVQQSTGTYAGPNVAYGQRVDSVDGTGYVGSGFHYFKNVERDEAPANQFSVDWNVKDTWNVYGAGANAPTDVHLRLTMLGEFDDIALADGIPPQNQPGNPASLRYLLAHRSGSNLDSVFTSVVEPYKGQRYIASIEPVKVLLNGTEVSVSEARAVKVILQNGRTDYIVSALKADVTYTVDGKISFKGYFGVYSERAGRSVYGYVNDGKMIGKPSNPIVQGEPGRLQGTVADFTKSLSMDNELTVNMDLQGLNMNRLVGESIYIKGDEKRNAVYRIQGIIQVAEGVFKLDVGDTTFVRRYVDDQDFGQGFVYDVTENADFYIPLRYSRSLNISPPGSGSGTPTGDYSSKETEGPDANMQALKYSSKETEGPDANMQALKASDIKRDAHGYSIVQVAAGKTGISFTRDVLDVLGSNGLLIDAGGIVLTLPSELISRLTSQTSGKEEFAITFSTPGEKEISQALNQAGEREHALLTKVSPAYDVRINGISPRTKLEPPGKISLALEPQADKALTGIYAIGDNGMLKYVGGKIVGDRIEASLSEAGRLVVLTYDKSFIDVQNQHWAFRMLKEMAALHLIEGVGNEKYEPSRSVTRAEFTALLVRMLGLPALASQRFTDVDSSKWYAGVVAAAVERGLVQGVSKEKFAPDRVITREEMVVMLIRAYEMKSGVSISANQASSFRDRGQTSDWALDSLDAAAELGLISGRGAGLFVPAGLTSRAEAAQSIYNLLQKK